MILESRLFKKYSTDIDLVKCAGKSGPRRFKIALAEDCELNTTSGYSKEERNANFFILQVRKGNFAGVQANI